MPRVGSSHLRARWDVSRLTGRASFTAAMALHADVRPPRLMRPDRAARLRVQALRHGQRVLRCAAQGGAALYPGDAGPLLAGVRRLPAGNCASYAQADTIHLVMDNLSTHRLKAVVERFGEKDGGWLWNRFTVHYTPKHGSWLNQAEIEISLFSRQCLGTRRIASINDLRREANAWNRKMNRDQVAIDWRFTRKKARLKFGCKRNLITRSET